MRGRAVMWAGAGVVGAAAAAWGQPSVAIDLAGVRVQNGLNQARSSAPNTVGPAHRYQFVVSGMVRGSGGVMSVLFPGPTPLAQALETLSPGASSFLTGQFDNCGGAHPVNPAPGSISGTEVVLGINVTYGMTITFAIDAGGVAAFNLTGVVLTPSILVGSLVFDSGSATLTRVVTCPPNCDGSTVPPVLNVSDFTCFLQKFAAGDPSTNCDCSTAPPVLNVGDFTCFLQQFAAGCPG